jgi:hypothetical protein
MTVFAIIVFFIVRFPVAVENHPKNNVPTNIAHVIGKAVWNQGGHIRDVISNEKLVRKNDGHEVEQILATNDYGARIPLNQVLFVDGLTAIFEKSICLNYLYVG